MAGGIEPLLIAALARMLDGLGHVAVGAASPIPGAAALLARTRGGGRPRISVLASERHNPFTDGGRELFDCAAQGRIDAFFLGGVQIDGAANINLIGVGGYPRTESRFPGCFGSAYLYHLVPRVILFRQEHSARTLVPRVEFVSAAGTGPAHHYRPGGPHALVTGRCVFAFDRARGRFRLQSLHPGETLERVRAATGFDFDVAEDLQETPAPDAATMELIEGPVAEAVAETYPAFARRVFGAQHAA